MRKISKYDDIIDSRDVIERLRELESDRELYKTEEGQGDWMAENGEEFTDNWTQEEEDEYQELSELDREGESYCSDWIHGETLIHEDYFEQYAEELASDIGAISHDAKWPLSHIDWHAAAEELKIDYAEVDFGGQTFYIRNY